MIAIDTTKLICSVCRESYFDFVVEFWDSVVAEPLVPNFHIEYICNQLQQLAEDVFAGNPRRHDLIINVPPGTTKSLLCSVFFCPWTWTRMPHARHINSTHAFDLGQDLSRRSRDVIIHESRPSGRPTYAECFPEICLRSDQNTKGMFSNISGGGRKSVTVGGKSPVGFHAHFLTVDDPINPQEAVSEADLRTADLFMRETLPTRKVDKEITPTVLVMQRLAEGDPTGSWLERVKSNKDNSVPVRHIKLPPDLNEGYEVSPRHLRRRYVDGLLDPKRMSRKVLAEYHVALGEYGYAGQFGQEPVPRGGGLFKVEKIGAPETPPAKFLKVCRFWDKAGTPKGGAYTAGVKLGLDRDGVWWFLHVVRGQWDAFVREQIIQSTAVMDGKSVIVGVEQEPGSGGKESAEATVRNLAGFRVKIDRPTGDKVARAEPLASQVNGGNVRIAKGEWNQDLLDELRLFWFGKFKDQVDAAAGAFNILAASKNKVGVLFSGS